MENILYFKMMTQLIYIKHDMYKRRTENAKT